VRMFYKLPQSISFLIFVLFINIFIEGYVARLYAFEIDEQSLKLNSILNQLCNPRKTSNDNDDVNEFTQIIMQANNIKNFPEWLQSLPISFFEHLIKQLTSHKKKILSQKNNTVKNTHSLKINSCANDVDNFISKIEGLFSELKSLQKHITILGNYIKHIKTMHIEKIEWPSDRICHECKNVWQIVNQVINYKNISLQRPNTLGEIPRLITIFKNHRKEMCGFILQLNNIDLYSIIDKRFGYYSWTKTYASIKKIQTELKTNNVLLRICQN